MVRRFSELGPVSAPPGMRPPRRQSRFVTAGMAVLGVIALAAVALTGVVYYSGDNNQIAEKENADALEQVRKTGRTEVITLTAEQKAEWKKALAKVHRETEGRVGKDLLESIYKETGADPNRL